MSDNVGVVGEITTAEVRIVGGPGGTNPAPTVTVAERTAGSNVQVATVNRPLVPGDRLIINPGAVEDAAGNRSAGTSGAAIKAQASPRINQVLMSELKHTAHATWTVPTDSVAGAATPHAVRIQAKGDGDAAGAAGNDWSMVFDRASTYSTAKPLDIGVSVDPKGKRVTVRFNNGPTTATLGDLIKALNADTEFSALFSAGFADCNTGVATTPLGLATARNVAAGFSDSGRTQFAIEVNFNAYVDVVDNSELLVDILTATALRNKLDWTGATSARFALVNVAATGGDAAAAGGVLTIFEDLNAESTALPSITAGVSTTPVRSVRYEFEASQVKFLPKARDLVETAAGRQAGSEVTGPPLIPEVTEVASVATGYASDDAPAGTTATDTAADKVDEQFNGYSQNRIQISSSVKAPS